MTIRTWQAQPALLTASTDAVPAVVSQIGQHFSAIRDPESGAKVSELRDRRRLGLRSVNPRAGAA